VKDDIYSINLIVFLFLSMVYFFPMAKEGQLSKHTGSYKGEKRRKELSRQKKQEERRQRRFHKGDPTPTGTEKVEQKEIEPTNP
jgi:hypothetical protein